MTMTPQSWARDLLRRLGYPITVNNMTSVLAWEYAEGGHFHNSAHYNPLNTTMASAQFGAINGDGVASYPDYETGMRETIATLKLPAYAAIRHDLAHNASPARTTADIAASPWGTWHGSTPGPIVERASRDVHAHPSWVHPVRPRQRHPGNGRGGKVVLDLDELHRLSTVYRDATDRVLRTRLSVQEIGYDVQAACRALPDRAVADAITSAFEYVTDPAYGFDRDARLTDELSGYLADVRRLAEQADANSDGHWTHAERVAFAAKHQGQNDPALRAVLEALHGGTISRHAGHPKGGPESHTEKAIADVLALAERQHAAEHNGDNVVKYNQWYGDPGQPWCATFVSWVFWHAGHRLPAIGSPKGFAYVPDAIAYARAHSPLDAHPHAGDVFLLKDGSHTGIVTKVHPDGRFDTVEGNWSNQVSRLTRNAGDGSYLFWSPIR